MFTIDSDAKYSHFTLMHLFSRKSTELLFNSYVIALRTALPFLLPIFYRLYVWLSVAVFFVASVVVVVVVVRNRIEKREKKIIILHKCRDIFSFVFVRASYHVSTVLNLFHKKLHSLELCICRHSVTYNNVSEF